MIDNARLRKAVGLGLGCRMSFAWEDHSTTFIAHDTQWTDRPSERLMWAWLEPHDLYWRRVSTKMHSHLHTKDNTGTFFLQLRLRSSSTPPGGRRAIDFTQEHGPLHLFLANQRIGCEEIMNALDECHARGFLYKAVGGCNDIKREVNKCLSGARAQKSGKNRETAVQRRLRIEEVWSKMDDGDYTALERFTKTK